MKNIAIISGASSGMGKEFAIQVSKKYNYDEIWLVARRADKLEELANQINNEKNFPIAKPVVLDICGKAGANSFGALLKAEDDKLKIMESSLKIGLLINNAGFVFCRINPLKSFLDWIYIKNISRQSDTYLPPAV